MFEQISNMRNALPSLKSFRDMKPIARREFRQGLIFIAPWIVGFLVFTFLPIIASFLFSFMDLKITSGILSKPHFVGFANYQFLFKDGQVWTSPGALWVTFRFGLIALPIGILVPLG